MLLLQLFCIFYYKLENQSILSSFTTFLMVLKHVVQA